MNTLKDLLHHTLGRRWANQRTVDLTFARAQEMVALLGPGTLIGQLRADHVVDAADLLRDRGNSPGTINRKLSTLNAMLEEARRAGKPVRVDRMPWAPEPRGRTRWLTASEVEELADAMPSPEMYALVRFLSWTGLRVGEALALEWDDVEATSVRVRTLKGGSFRRVPLTEPAYATLMSQRHRPRPFCLSQSQVNHQFRAGRDALPWARNDKEVVPHILRHTCASWLIQRGVALPVVQAWLGHRSYRSTLRYTHIADADLANAAAALEGR